MQDYPLYSRRERHIALFKSPKSRLSLGQNRAFKLGVDYGGISESNHPGAQPT